MKIVQLVTEKTNSSLHESIAKQIPRGLNSQQEIFNVGYKLAVKTVGLKEAQQLNTKFATQLLASYYRQHLDEGLGSAIGYGAGKLAKGAGAIAGGLAGMWDAAKKGFAAGRGTVSSAADDEPATAPAPTGGAAGGTAPSGDATVGGEVASNDLLNRAKQGTTQDPNATPAPAPAPAGNPQLDAIMKDIQGLDDASKKELLAQLQGKPAEPAPAEQPAAGQSVELDPAKAAADKQAKNAADAAERDAQIAATKQSNAQTAAADNALVAAVKAAKAKPAFQQTAQDKLTIKQGAEKGIHESKKKKKKVVAEFNSKFLGMKI